MSSIGKLLGETIRDNSRMKRGVCVECGHAEDSHTWSRDGVPCGECRCDNFWNGKD